MLFVVVQGSCACVWWCKEWFLENIYSCHQFLFLYMAVSINEQAELVKKTFFLTCLQVPLFNMLVSFNEHAELVKKTILADFINNSTIVVLSLIDVTIFQECMAGFYGVDCHQLCLCQNGGLCDKASGHCSCTEGWTGIECELGEKICFCTYQCILPIMCYSHYRDQVPLPFSLFLNRVCSRFLWCWLPACM